MRSWSPMASVLFAANIAAVSPKYFLVHCSRTILRLHHVTYVGMMKHHVVPHIHNSQVADPSMYWWFYCLGTHAATPMRRLGSKSPPKRLSNTM
eukprot:2832625-Amphidinium_carterae.1